jgi:hypothetical protein
MILIYYMVKLMSSIIYNGGVGFEPTWRRIKNVNKKSRSPTNLGYPPVKD